MQIFSVSSAEQDTASVGYNIVSTSTAFYLKNANSGQYLDLDHGIDKNNTNILQWKYNSGKNQQWKFVKVGTVQDGYVYKIVSVNSSSDRVIDVSKGGSANGQNIALYQYKGSSNQQFALIKTARGAYRILSKCSNYKSALTVKEKSCSQGANVIQYQYNGSHNDEWYLEPVRKSVNFGISYANANAMNYNTFTYPNCTHLNGDCANFVSQCMASSGIHYKGNWYIYRKNNNYSSPANIPQLDNSWQLSSPSPWISAKYFGKFWAPKVQIYTVSGKDLANGIKLPDHFGAGDVVQYGEIPKNYDQISDFIAIHTMYITAYNPKTREYTVSYHSRDTKNAELRKSIKDSKDLQGQTFRFYDIM